MAFRGRHIVRVSTVGSVGAAVVLPILRIKNTTKFRFLLLERNSRSIFTSIMIYGSRYYHKSPLIDLTGDRDV